MVGAAQGRSGSGFNCRVDASRGGCWAEASPVIVSLFLVSLFPRAKAPQVIHTAPLRPGQVLGPGLV